MMILTVAAFSLAVVALFYVWCLMQQVINMASDMEAQQRYVRELAYFATLVNDGEYGGRADMDLLRYVANWENDIPSSVDIQV